MSVTTWTRGNSNKKCDLWQLTKLSHPHVAFYVFWPSTKYCCHFLPPSLKCDDCCCHRWRRSFSFLSRRKHLFLPFLSLHQKLILSEKNKKVCHIQLGQFISGGLPDNRLGLEIAEKWGKTSRLGLKNLIRRRLRLVAVILISSRSWKSKFQASFLNFESFSVIFLIFSRNFLLLVGFDCRTPKSLDLYLLNWTCNFSKASTFPENFRVAYLVGGEAVW